MLNFVLIVWPNHFLETFHVLQQERENENEACTQYQQRFFTVYLSSLYSLLECLIETVNDVCSVEFRVRRDYMRYERLCLLCEVLLDGLATVLSVCRALIQFNTHISLVAQFKVGLLDKLAYGIHQLDSSKYILVSRKLLLAVQCIISFPLAIR